MSQAGIISMTASPAVPTSFVEDTGTATPALNVLNVVTSGGGIATAGAGSTITISLTNRLSGTTTTNDGAAHTAVSVPLGAVPGTYTFDLRVAGFDAANNLSVGYTLVTSVRTTGAAGVLVVPFAPVNLQTLDEFEEAALTAADCYVDVAGNNALIQVVGVAAHTINWRVEGTYTFVS